jgi:hypothetical protein
MKLYRDCSICPLSFRSNSLLDSEEEEEEEEEEQESFLTGI